MSAKGMYKGCKTCACFHCNRNDKYACNCNDCLGKFGHDPSGIDMARDIQERLELFEADVKVKRIALTMEQIHEFTPPPNPAKLSDSRCGGYIKKYGYSSWELDALRPQVITDLIRDNVLEYLDTEKYENIKSNEEVDKRNIEGIEKAYHDVIYYLGNDFNGIDDWVSAEEMQDKYVSSHDWQRPYREFHRKLMERGSYDE